MHMGGSFLVPSFRRRVTFTSSDLTEDQRSIRDLAREWANDNLDEDTVEAIENKDIAVNRRLLAQMGELGLLGVDVPERFGGIGMGLTESAIVAEEVARHGGSFATTFSAHTGIGIWPLERFGTEEQKARHLPKLVSGQCIASYMLTEPDAGSDAGAMQMTATPDGDSFILNGGKAFITNARIAGLATVFAKIPRVGPSAFLVEMDSPGITVCKEEQKLGIKGSFTAPVTFDSVRVPAANLLGKPGKGMKIALTTLKLGRFKLGAACLGAGRTVLDDAVSYAKQRVQFGQPIIEYGLVRQLIAGMAARLAAMDAIVYRTAALLDTPTGIDHTMECSIVKVFCSEALWWMTDANVQVHGGYGFIEEYRAPRFLRDSRVNRLFEGTSEINLLVVGGEVVRQKLLWSLLNPAFWLGVRRLDGSRRAALLRMGWLLARYRKGLKHHQIRVGAVSDRIIQLYVLDSLLAGYRKHRSQPWRLAYRHLRSRTVRERTVNRLVDGLA